MVTQNEKMKAYISALIVCIIVFVCGRITDNNFDSLVSAGLNEEVVGVTSFMLQAFSGVIFGILIIGGLFFLVLHLLRVVEKLVCSK
jgi:succinate dehydrogenase hydrophobic anchor subunit